MKKCVAICEEGLFDLTFLRGANAPSRLPPQRNPGTTVEPLKKGHFGNGTFVLSSEVVLISEVHEIF